VAAPVQHWSVEIFKVTDQDRQEKILGIFLEAGLPHVLALGAQSGHECYVTVETSSVDDRIFVRRVISTVDPGAQRTYLSREAPIPGPIPA
jgi:hypothetical protein